MDLEIEKFLISVSNVVFLKDFENFEDMVGIDILHELDEFLE
jgi:hypothetical protein